MSNILDEIHAVFDKAVADVESVIHKYGHDLAPIADLAVSGLEAVDPAATPIVNEVEKIGEGVIDEATQISVAPASDPTAVTQVGTTKTVPVAPPVAATTDVPGTVTTVVDSATSITTDAEDIASEPATATTAEEKRAAAAKLLEEANALITEANTEVPTA